MLVSTSPRKSSRGSDWLTLRWLEGPNSISREEAVEIIETHVTDALTVIRGPFELGEKTPVYLTGKGYMGNGIVRACQKHGSDFLLTIGLTNFNPERDPGVLSVQEFISEEDAEKILKDMENFTLRIVLSRTTGILSWWIFGVQNLMRKLFPYDPALSDHGAR